MPPVKLARRWVPALLAVLVSASEAAPARAGEESDGERSLRERVGVSTGRALLSSGTYEDRLRGVERLSRIGDREALDALVDSLDGGGPIVADPRTRLAVSRALAPHALSDVGRRGLVGILGHALDEDGDPALGELARDTAAWALARAAAGVAPRSSLRQEPVDGIAATTPEERALVPLLTALIGDTGAGEAARRAVIAHPPRDLRAFLRGVATMTVAEARLLGELRDPRAIGMLRGALVAGDDALKDAAMLALATLGDHAGGARAKALLATAELPAERRTLAAEAVCVLGEESCAPAVHALLAVPESEALGLALAERFPHRSLVPGLIGVTRASKSLESLGRALMLLGESGVDDALVALESSLRDPRSAPFARAALAESDAPGADEMVARWIEQSTGAERVEALRVAIARAAGARRSAAERLLALVRSESERAIASPEARVASLGWFAATLLGGREPSVGLASSERHVRAAVVSALASMDLTRVAPLLEPLARRALQASESGAADPVDETALALALVGSSDFGSFDELARLAESGTLASPQAAYRLATRDPRSSRERVDALLLGTSSIVRAHAALGLGESPEPSAAVRLVAAYRREIAPAVRRAIVRALSRRSEVVRIAALESAATIDPDDEVRHLASLALSGRRLGSSSPWRERARWLTVSPSRPDDLAAVALRPVRVEVHGELARSALAGPDGALVVFAPSRGDVVLRPLPLR
jgi:hypothetical protein